MVSASISSVIQQHAVDAAFLWLLRDAAVSAPHYNLADPAALDDRCAAYLDGLRIAGQDGEALAFEAFSEDAPGETFAATVLCILSQNSGGLRKALGEGDPEAIKGFSSTLGWLSWNDVAPVAQSYVENPSDFRRAVGISAYAIQHQDPEHRLAGRLQDDNTLVLAQKTKPVTYRRLAFLTRIQFTMVQPYCVRDVIPAFWLLMTRNVRKSHD